MDASEPDELLTADAVAERWDKSPKTIYAMAADGRLPHLRRGRTIRFRLVDVEAFERFAPATRGPLAEATREAASP